MKIIILLLFAIIPFAKNNNSEEVLSKMHKQYAGKWMKSFSFAQTTGSYRNDSLIKTATWYENIIYPDKFRIDFGDTTSGNAAIFTKDSVYSFRNAKLVHTYGNEDDLTFILGGMYFYPFDSVKAIFIRSGYDLNKFCEVKVNDKDVYVIGANNINEKTNQVWIDKQNLFVVKFVKYTGDEREEGVFKNHKQFGTGWSETACDFYENGKLIQTESYFNCQADNNIDPKIFDTQHFSLLH